MTSERNKALATRIIEEVWNRGDDTALETLLAPGYVGRDPAYPVASRAEFGTFLHRFRATFPDLRFSVEAQIAEGDWVVTRWRARGSHQGELSGLPATGKSVAITGITLSRIVAGQVVEDWRNWDTLGLIEQLGTDPLTHQRTTENP
ncbi:MAG: ester cyclase [Thermomicrobiales bacterium]